MKQNNKIRPIMTLRETEDAYCATIKDVVVNVAKNNIVIENGIKQHPRLTAIETAARLAGVTEWLIMNI